MDDEIELLKDVSKRLSSIGINYMVTGSMAMAFYATPRMTRDIDLVIQVAEKDILPIIELFRDDFYIDESSVRKAVNDHGMFNIIHNESVIKFDFIVRKETIYRVKEFSRRQKLMIEGDEVSIVSPEDLILSKLVWAKQSESELQLRDVRNMALFAQGIDKTYLAKWSKELGVEELLKRVYDNE